MKQESTLKRKIKPEERSLAMVIADGNTFL